MSQLKIQHQIKSKVYRQWGRKKEGYWYEGYAVEKITPKQVWVRGFMDDHCIILKRSSLERSGFAVSSRHSAVFVTEMPEEYRKTTIGYLLDVEPRQALGLPEDYTRQDLKDAFRRKARETHPDMGGDPEAYKIVQMAYEKLSGGHSLGEILRFAMEES